MSEDGHLDGSAHRTGAHWLDVVDVLGCSRGHRHARAQIKSSGEVALESSHPCVMVPVDRQILAQERGGGGGGRLVAHEAQINGSVMARVWAGGGCGRCRPVISG